MSGRDFDAELAQAIAADPDLGAELIEEAFADHALAEGATYRSPVYAHPGTP